MQMLVAGRADRGGERWAGMVNASNSTKARAEQHCWG